MRRLATLLALALSASALAAVSARARGTSVAIGGKTIVIHAPGARAEIVRSPFRLRIEQRGGQGALAEVTNRRPRPLRIGPLEDPFGTGLDNRVTPTLYAPLTFLVGVEKLTQYQGGLWGGDLMSGTRFGVEYSARRVLTLRRLPGGVRMVLSTDDPSGRRLVVTVSSLGRGAIHVVALARPARGVAEIGDSFASSAGEGFFGFGGRHNAVDQHGEVFSSFVAEENLDNDNGQPNLSPNGNTGAYYPQAEFFSTRPYGFLLAQPQLARFKLDAGGGRAWNVTASASRLDYVVAPGPAPRAMATLTALSGRQPVPPRWALGPMLDRLTKNFGETVTDYEQNLLADLTNIRRYKLPLTAYRIEGWGFPKSSDNYGLALDTFTTPAVQGQVIRTLLSRGIHPVVYLRPWITPGSAPVKRGLVVRTASGTPYYTTTTSGKKIALLDFTNPAAVRFWQQLVARALDTGADGFMQDFGEEVLFNMHFHDGQTGVTMHSEYPVLYSQATRQELTRYEHAHPRRGKLFFFTRSGYSGLPGSAAFEGGNFPGDETTDFSHASGLASLTSDMLGRAVDGAYGYGTDIGGYFDLTTPPTTKELFLRWAEWAALSPIFRLHGSGLHGTHTPWSYDAQTVRVYESLSRLHLRAVPLIMSLWREADRTGMPITRPLWLAYPREPLARRQDQEWLLGPNLLVAPVVIQGAPSRTVFFPGGCWRSANGRRVFRGQRSARVSAGLTVLPYFTRCGTRAFAPVSG
jgi:alpha-glucosidase (family GH31 glycosyl hydrolase)